MTSKTTRRPTLSDVAVEAGVSRKTVSRFVNGDNVGLEIGSRVSAAIDFLGYERRIVAGAQAPDATPELRKTPTMNDVASHAGVALKTVSRFVNGQTNIDPVLSDRIAAAIKLLGYRRNLAAASIRPGRTNKMLGLIISDLANPFYSALSRAVEIYALNHGYLLTIGSSDDDGSRHDQLVDRLLGQQVDGLIVVPPRTAGRSWNQLEPHLPPLVFVDRLLDYQHADVVMSDNAAGGQAATAELLRHGAMKIAFVGDSLEIYSIAERHRGYRMAMGMVGGGDSNEGLVFANAHDEQDAAQIVGRLLNGNVVQAVFAANNRAALGSLRAFRDAGRRLPLIGFDDFDAADLMTPPVSVVSQDIEEMGRKAAEIVISRISGVMTPHRVHVLQPRLILRGSEISSTPITTSP